MVVQFDKETDKWCRKGSVFDKKSTFAEAVKACIENTDCLLFYDQKCDNKHSFKLCNSLDAIKPSKSGSCIYKKTKQGSK